MGYKEGIKYALGPNAEQAHWQAAYNRLVDQALTEAHGGPPDVSQRDTRYVGVPTPRNDAIYKVRGRAEFVGNLLPEGVLHGRFVRSIHPRAPHPEGRRVGGSIGARRRRCVDRR